MAALRDRHGIPCLGEISPGATQKHQGAPSIYLNNRGHQVFKYLQCGGGGGGWGVGEWDAGSLRGGASQDAGSLMGRRPSGFGGCGGQLPPAKNPTKTHNDRIKTPPIVYRQCTDVVSCMHWARPGTFLGRCLMVT